MKTDFAKEQFSTMPGWAKGVIGIGLLGGVAFAIYKIMNAPKDIRKHQTDRQETASVAQELDKANQNPATKQKLSKTDALAIANSLFTAMDGWGTDTVAIMKNLGRLQNQADWLAVSSAYGIKEVSSGRGNPEPNYTGTLSGALTSELGVNDLAMRNKINQYFASKGITARI